MNYDKSNQVLEKIKKADRILVNCHRGPDSDSIGSAMAMLHVLEQMDKEVNVVCPTEVPEDLLFLPGTNFIKRIDFSNYDFSEYDLFIALDSSTGSMITGSKEIDIPQIETVVIDHHVSNVGFGDLNLVDSKATSTSELLYRVFKDWDAFIDKDTANCLLTGIIGDTGAFQYPGVNQETLKVASDLMDLGADKDEIVYNIYRTINFDELKMWGKFLENMQIDKEHRFVWSALALSEYKEFGEFATAKEDVANLFLPVVKDTDFGIVMLEVSNKTLSVSLRSRRDFDVSKIAEAVGGGGHKLASGAKVEGMEFQEAVDLVLSKAREVVNEKKNS